MRYSKAYKEKAVKKVLEMRDTQTMGTIAKGLNRLLLKPQIKLE
ncbi:MAG: hypothetical protein Q9M43_02525 [Sulfurimonas sp.]|nr:hypothetical protein [Sulfurimonas sp.]